MARVPLALSRTKVGYHVPLSNFENEPPIPCGSPVFAACPLCAFFGSQSLVDLRYHTSLFFTLLPDTSVARTFQMAFNRRFLPSRGCEKQWQGYREKRNERRGRLALPRDNVDKNASTGEDSSSILPKSDRWQERLLLRLSTYRRYKRRYSYFPSPRSAVYTRERGRGVLPLLLSPSHPSHPSLILLSSSKYLSCRSVIYHGPCPLKDFNSGRRLANDFR